MKKLAFQQYGYNKQPMIKCSGCHNAYHYECWKKRVWITKKALEKQDNELTCNIWQLHLYLRNQHFIKTWLKKHGNEQDCTAVNNWFFTDKMKISKKN